MSYASPTDLDAALAALASGAPRVIAGGTDVFPAMAQGARPDDVLDVTRINGFADITRADGLFRIGAGVTWSMLISADLPAAFNALKAAAREVGSVQIQNVGTIGGNLCNASPAADGVPALLALDARVELASASNGRRVLDLRDFILGVRQTALAPDELLTAILVPEPAAEMTSAFAKLGSRSYLVISICMTAVNLIMEAGRIKDARIAVGACAPVARRLRALEKTIRGQRPEEIVIADDHLAVLSPIDDVRGSGAYRLDAVAEQIKRAIKEAAA